MTWFAYFEIEAKVLFLDEVSYFLKYFFEKGVASTN
jgi:hypothetical protein